MRTLLLMALAVTLAALIGTGCGPAYRVQQGAVAGAAVGAVVGHDIGEDSESTLIGAAVGGLAGAVVGDAVREYERCNYYGQCTPAATQYPQTQQYQPRRGY